MAVISMICGLASLASGIGGFAPGIAALVLSGLSLRKAPGIPNTMAKVGRITGIIGIVLSVLWVIIRVVLLIVSLVGSGPDVGSPHYYEF
jgi:hypothetical protein